MQTLTKRFFLIVLLALTWPSAVFAQQQYTCPMHPHYIATEMGTCPYCGMDLVPIDSDEEDESMGMAADDGQDNAARTSIKIPSQTIQKMGVRTEQATMATFGQDIRSYASVSENRRLTQALSSRVAGWIESITITAIGDVVSAGDELYRLYSPDLVSAQQDYIAALNAGQQGRINASSARLSAFGLHDDTIAQLARSRKVMQQVPFLAKANGIVSELMVNLGDYVAAGQLIGRIQDYKSVWVNVNVAQQDLSFIDNTSDVTVIFPTLGNHTQKAQIDYIEPTIDPMSRTGKIRLVLDNTQGKLRPGAYADVEFEVNLEKRLSVPSEALLNSIDGSFIVRALGEGRFQPVLVQTGIQNGARTEIISGLNDGDEIVVSGQFLLDSESALRESFQQLQQAQIDLADIDVSEVQMAMLNHYIDAALYTHETLYKDSTFNAKFLDPALLIKDTLLPAFRNTKMEFIIDDTHIAIDALAKTTTRKQRSQALSIVVEALKPWITQGAPKYYFDKNVRLFLDHGSNQHWLQLGDDMQHPYGDGHAVPVPLEIMEEMDSMDSMDSEDMQDMTSSSSESAIMGGAHANH